MKEGKSKLLQAARRVRAEIYKTVEAELSDATRNLSINCGCELYFRRYGTKNCRNSRNFTASRTAPTVVYIGGW